MRINQTIKNIKRAREVLNVVVKYGFEDMITSTALNRLVPENTRSNWMRNEKPVMEHTRWERIRMICEELGPTFVKGAQVLSNRADILPEELINEFQKLQSEVPPFDTDTAINIVEEELGMNVKGIFQSFDDVPVGSASIGQVHRAKLRSGQKVVVKIQRPGIREKIDTDLSIIKELVRMGENYFEKNGITNAMDAVLAFEKTMQKELDYQHEVRNINQFRSYYKDHDNFYVPHAYKEYSSDKVMVLEYVEGCKITDVHQLRKWDLRPPEIAEEGLDIYLSPNF